MTDPSVRGPLARLSPIVEVITAVYSAITETVPSK